MFYCSILKNKKVSLFSLIFIFIGLSCMILTVTLDLYKSDKPDFGIFQLAGFAVSAIIMLVGIRKIAFSNARMWDRMFLLVYIAGILFMGLKSPSYSFHRSSGILQDHSFSFADVVVNLLGFVPLGYLLMLNFLSSDKIRNKITAVSLSIAGSICISLFIESAQVFIPDRCSSIVDLFFNGLGAFVGIIFCLIENRLSTNI